MKLIQILNGSATMKNEFKNMLSDIEQLNREKPEEVYAFIETKLLDYIDTYKSS